MVYKLHKAMIFVFVCVVTLGHTQYSDAFDKPTVGGKYSKTFEASRNGPRAFLPEGEWELAYSDITSNNLVTRIGHFILFQSEGGKIKNIISIVQSVEWASGGYVASRMCGRTNMHLNITELNIVGGEQSCYYVNHFTPTFYTTRNQKNKKGFDVQKYFEKNGISMPHHYIYSGYRFAEEDSFIDVKYYRNPVIDGFDNYPRSEWGSSPWHSSSMVNDAIKKEYIQKYIEWTKENYEIARNNFKRKSYALDHIIRYPFKPNAEKSTEFTVSEKNKEQKKAMELTSEYLAVDLETLDIENLKSLDLCVINKFRKSEMLESEIEKRGLRCSNILRINNN